MPPVTKKYRDFDLSFIPHPISGDITVLKNGNAVKQAIKNLILTNVYERFFQPNLGSGIAQLLFEPINPMTRLSIKIAIEDVIKNFEPRAELIEIIVNVDADENGYDCKIRFAATAASQREW